MTESCEAQGRGGCQWTAGAFHQADDVRTKENSVDMKNISSARKFKAYSQTGHLSDNSKNTSKMSSKSRVERRSERTIQRM